MDRPEASPPSQPGRLLRPYALTRGRARPSHGSDLELEALVSTTMIGETMHMPAPGVARPGGPPPLDPPSPQGVAAPGARPRQPAGAPGAPPADDRPPGRLG